MPQPQKVPLAPALPSMFQLKIVVPFHHCVPELPHGVVSEEGGVLWCQPWAGSSEVKKLLIEELEPALHMPEKPPCVFPPFVPKLPRPSFVSGGASMPGPWVIVVSYERVL